MHKFFYFLFFFYSELTQFIPIEVDSIQLSQSGSMASISSYTKGGTAGTPAGKPQHVHVQHTCTCNMNDNLHVHYNKNSSTIYMYYEYQILTTCIYMYTCTCT